MLKIRRPLGRLIFNMGIAIPGKTVFLIETDPWCFGSMRYRGISRHDIETKLHHLPIVCGFINLLMMANCAGHDGSFNEPINSIGFPYVDKITVVWWNYDHFVNISWWRHGMETFSALLTLCAANYQSPVNSLHEGQWRGALIFSLICFCTNGWVNNRDAGDLRRNRAHYDVIVMWESNV